MTRAQAAFPATDQLGYAFTVRAAPRREPPFEDELDSTPRLARYGEPILPFELRPGRMRRQAEWAAAQPTLRRDLPEPTAWARRLLVAVLEVRAGRRPLQQLSAQLSHGVFAGLTADAARRAGRHPVAPVATLRSVHVGQPDDGIAEVAAVIQTGARYRAVALRLEGLDGRWRCVRLQIG